jgi:hypothetical protein
MCATKKFKKYWLRPFEVFPTPINNKSFEFNLQLLDHYKNALRVRFKFVEYFLLVIFPIQQQLLRFLKMAISLKILANTIFIKNCFAWLRFNFQVHKTRSKSYSLDPSKHISIFILNLISKRFRKFFFFT